uniref:Sushi domain-containing protein n=1 Tax=Propithecus coquereli TaxID=379532 RepID=A0A2K6GGM2_PROCO
MSLARPSAPTVLCLIGGLYLLLLSAFSCLGDCSPPSEVPNAHPDLKGLSSFPVNSTVTYRCNEDFVKIPGQTDTVICLENDQWSEISEFCNQKSCPNPGELINGHINGTTDFLFGATIYFSCNTGYKLIGEKSSLCVIMGDNVGWTEQLPVCREIYCQEPPKIENGRIVRGEREQYVYSQAVMYACNRGFTLIGEDTIHCSARGDEGEWSGPAPQCRGNRVLYKAPLILQKRTTVNVPVTGVSPTPQKRTTVHVPATGVIPTPQKHTTVHVPAIGVSPTPQKHEMFCKCLLGLFGLMFSVNPRFLC